MWAAALVAAGVGLVLLWPGRFYVEKSLTRLALPTGLIWLGAWTLAAALLARKKWWEGAAAGVLAAAITVAGNPVVANRLAGRLQRDHARDPLAAGEFDAVCVLGGGVSLDEHDRPVANAFGQRAVLGAELFHAGRTPTLLAAGTAPPTSACPGPGRATRDLWANLAVPRDRVRLLSGTTTKEEIASLADAVKAGRWRRVGLVSSAWHLPRAVRLAEAAGTVRDARGGGNGGRGGRVRGSFIKNAGAAGRGARARGPGAGGVRTGPPAGGRGGAAVDRFAALDPGERSVRDHRPVRPGVAGAAGGPVR